MSLFVPVRGGTDAWERVKVASRSNCSVRFSAVGVGESRGPLGFPCRRLGLEVGGQGSRRKFRVEIGTEIQGNEDNEGDDCGEARAGGRLTEESTARTESGDDNEWENRCEN